MQVLFASLGGDLETGEPKHHQGQDMKQELRKARDVIFEFPQRFL